jgi:uncharacterized protein (TIGR01244 family)
MRAPNIKSAGRGFYIAGALLFLFALALSVDAFADDDSASYPELPNFHKVNENLYRGAQPKPGGVARLAALGIKTIINLRESNEMAGPEESEARAAGMLYFSVPMESLGRPTDEQINRVLALINDTQNAPVFVHCNKGRDRTGTVIACYRISRNGWTSKQAKDEARRYGLSRFLIWNADYISDFARDRRWLGQPSSTKQSSVDKSASSAVPK